MICAGLTGLAVTLNAQQQPRPAAAPATARQSAVAGDPFRTHEAGEPTDRVKPDELLRLKIVGDTLVAETALRPGGPQLLQVEGLPSPVRVTIRHRDANPGKIYVPDSIDNMNMLVRDGDRVTATSLYTTPGTLNIARSIETPTGEYSIQFIQSAGSGVNPPTRRYSCRICANRRTG